MGVDISKMRRGYQREQRGGEYLQLQAGETLLYIHPPCRPDDKFEPTDGVNYVPVVVHYGIGRGSKGSDGKTSNGRMVASLDPEINPILEHPFIKRYLKQRKVRITGECPVSKMLQSGDLDDKELDDMRASTRYVWGVTPIAHRSSSADSWNQMVPKPSVLMVGKTVYDGIMEVFFDNGDITDPNEAVLVIVKRTGEKMTTKYIVKADGESVKKPKKLSKEVRAAIAKATKEDGDCDLFKVVANMIKSPAEVSALLSGVKLEDAEGEDFDEDEEDKSSEDEDDDDGEAELFEKPKSKSDDDEDDEDEEEDEEEERPKAVAKASKSSKSTSKPKPKTRAEEDEEEDSEEEDEEDEKPAPKPSKSAKSPKPKSKAAVVEEDDEEVDEPEESEDDDDESDSDDDDADDDSDDSEDSDSDDDDDSESDDSDDDVEEDEPEEKPAPKAEKAAKSKNADKAGKPAKAAKPAVDDDDDLGLSEIDAELERIATKGKEDKAKPKKTKSSSTEARA